MHPRKQRDISFGLISELAVLVQVCENKSVEISACIIAFNEEENIAKAIKSISWANEIIVIDSESTDRTREISEELGAKVIVKKWIGFAKQKQFAVDNCSHDWVFSLDADEVVSNALRNEILQLKNSKKKLKIDGFKIPRLSHYMNKPIRHCGWYPDWQLRFFNRKKGKWEKVPIHESFVMDKDARVEKLCADILHYSIKDSAYHNEMIGARYAPLAAEKMFQSGKRSSKLKIAMVGFTSFVNTFFLKNRFLGWFRRFLHSSFCGSSCLLKISITLGKTK